MAITEESRMDEDENGEDTKVFYIPLSDEAIYGMKDWMEETRLMKLD